MPDGKFDPSVSRQLEKLSEEEIDIWESYQTVGCVLGFGLGVIMVVAGLVLTALT